MQYFILSEANLPKLLWRAWRDKPTCVVTTRSLAKGAATGHLDKIVDSLRAKGRITVQRKDHEDRVLYPFFADLIRCTDVFSESEPWMEKVFKFDKADKTYGTYAAAYRHICSCLAFSYYETAYLIHGLEPEPEESKTVVVGGDQIDEIFHAHRFGETNKLFQRRLRLDRLINAAMGFAILVYSVMRVIGYIRIRSPTREEIFLGSDFAGSPHDNILWNELAERDKSVVVIPRNSLQAEHYGELLTGQRTCSKDAGYYSLSGALEALRDVVFDTVKISLRGNHLPSPFFRQLVTLPHRRVVYRALFNRFDFKNFWCRDDYNADHHMRSQELRRAGSKSFGVMHGIPAICAVMQQLRHLDFDVYFVAGTYQYERYYKEKWPAHMRVQSIGTFGLTREEFWKLREPKKRDIALFIGRIFQEDQSIAATKALAEAFPDKKLYINARAKDLDPSTSFGRKMQAFLDTAPNNVILHSGRAYDLLFCCTYAFSDGSTLSAEALQVGLDSYIFDFQPTVWKVLNYRELPGVCVNSVDQAIDVIKKAEDGTWFLPRETYPSLIDLSGKIAWDQILWDMGVLNEPPAPLPHLAAITPN
jgi:hypothetical protein